MSLAWVDDENQNAEEDTLDAVHAADPYLTFRYCRALDAWDQAARSWDDDSNDIGGVGLWRIESHDPYRWDHPSAARDFLLSPYQSEPWSDVHAPVWPSASAGAESRVLDRETITSLIERWGESVAESASTTREAVADLLRAAARRLAQPQASDDDRSRVIGSDGADGNQDEQLLDDDEGVLLVDWVALNATAARRSVVRLVDEDDNPVLPLHPRLPSADEWPAEIDDEELLIE